MITSKQDANQVLKLAYDDATQSIRVSGGSSGGTTTVIQPDGALLHATIDESALPTGAATEAKQDAANATLLDIDMVASETAANTLATAGTLSSLNAKSAAAMVTVPYDEQEITYVGATTDVDQVIYKNASVTVATVTLSYDGQGRLTGVVRS